MQRIAIRVVVLALLAGIIAPAAFAFEPFTVSDIRLEGLTRVPAGTVFASLPIEKGDNIDRLRAAEAVRSLFKTGFFNDIQIAKQGNILVVTLIERPAIAKLELTGNKDIKTEDLMKGLREIGLAEGETFDRLQLDRITQELTRQYNNRGKYSVSVKPQVEELDRNRVAITIAIKEGKPAKIRHINIVGNSEYLDEEILPEFESSETDWLSWYKKDDQYSREKLSGDMEKLASFYQDRGYVDFSVESTQVAISPDKRNLYLTANVREGDVYTLSDIKLTGDLVFSEEVMKRLIYAKPGEIYSRRKFENSADAMTRVLSNVGYAFAEVTPVPEADKDKKTIAITLLVNPGKRVYVRRVNFIGNQRTQDEVLRREMRQIEGSWFSQAAIDRSKIRLQRLGFFKEVKIETPKVAGAEDQVDVIVNVTEQSAGSFQFSVGYSAFQGVLTSIALTQRNFLGSGNSVGVTVQNNRYTQRFDFSFFDPYFTDDGISVGYQLSYLKQDYGTSNNNNFAQYTSNVASGQVLLGIPLTETDTLSLALGIDRNQITTNDNATPNTLIQQLIDELGPRQLFPIFHIDDDGDGDPNDLDDDDGIPGIDLLNYGSNRRWNVNTWSLSTGWQRDSRNKFFAPTAGTFQRIGAEIALPGSDYEYWKLNYEYGHYFPIGSRFSLLTRAELGYGDGYGNNNSLPFYKNFYAGGTRSVRGFEENTLGPYEITGGITSTFRQPLGGAFKTVATTELIFPTPFAKADSDSSQFSAFFDVGNVFADFDAFETDELRASAGLSFKWQAPVGPIIINLARPLKKQEGDRTESIQFSFGNQF